MRFVNDGMRDLVASQKNDHGLSYRRYGAPQRRSCPNISIREIFGVVRFSTFDTISARIGSRDSWFKSQSKGYQTRTTRFRGAIPRPIAGTDDFRASSDLTHGVAGFLIRPLPRHSVHFGG
jgi:hypothetical protein